MLSVREVDGYTVHHLVPRARGGRLDPTAILCSICHPQIHALFSEGTLADELHSVALLRANRRVSCGSAYAEGKKRRHNA